jgi:hypothetical protein
VQAQPPLVHPSAPSAASIAAAAHNSSELEPLKGIARGGPRPR